MGSRFTWSNHQISAIRSVLDRVFVCHNWDTLFPLALLKAKAIVGSDHAPLILDTGLQLPPNPPRFQFDASWLLSDGFCDLLSSKISALLSANRRSFGPMDDWHHCSYSLRKFLHGWACNHAAEERREKASLTNQISALDSLADGLGLSDQEWVLRFSLEDSLVQLHRQAEIYWRQWGMIN